MNTYADIRQQDLCIGDWQHGSCCLFTKIRMKNAGRCQGHLSFVDPAAKEIYGTTLNYIPIKVCVWSTSH